MTRLLGFIVALLLSVTVTVGAQSAPVARPNISLAALNACTVLPISGMGTGVWQVTGTYTGVVTWTVTADNSTWVAIDAFPPDTQTAANATTSGGTGVWAASVAGLRSMRACMTTYSSGTAVVTLSAAATGGGGGGSSGGGGGAGTSDTTEATQLNVLASVDGLEGGLGAAADAAATQGSTGSVSAKLRTATAQLNTLNGLLAGGLPAALGAGGGLKIDGSGTTLPVSGTVTATATNLDVQIGGSDTVQVQSNSANLATQTTLALLLTDAHFTTYFGTSANSATVPLAVRVTDGSAFIVANTQGTHDTALGTITNVTGGMGMCRASAAVPTDTSADGDATLCWVLRSGAAAVQPTFGGVLATVAAGTAATAQRMVIATDDPVNDAAVKFDAQMVADDAATAGNPLYIGGLATASIVGQTPVAGADRIGFVGGLDRVIIVREHADLEDRVSAVVGVTDGSSTSLVAAQGAGVRFCATTFIVSNSSATNVTVDIRDGTAGSVIATIPAAANMGGATPTLPVPLCTTANTAMAMDPSAAATTVTVTAIGFKTEL